jgi:hypothetical protein
MELKDLAAEIRRRAESKRDLLAPVSKLVMEGGGQLSVINGKLERYFVNEIAHEQIADYTGIPMGYYRRMLADESTILATNVNHWFGRKENDRRLVRTLDGKVRAFLSDKYRPLEHEDLAEAVLPIIGQARMQIVSAYITDRKLYIKAIEPSTLRSVPTGKKVGMSVEHQQVCPAVVISNSEVGHGALQILSGVYTQRDHLMTMGASLRKYHTGARADISDEVYEILSDDTKRATDVALWKQVQDIVRSAVDEAKFEAICAKLGEAAADVILPEQAVEVVERFARRYTLQDSEKKGVLAALIEGGDLTRFGLSAAVCRHSEFVDDYDRASEMERTAGEVIELSRSQWRDLVN